MSGHVNAWLLHSLIDVMSNVSEHSSCMCVCRNSVRVYVYVHVYVYVYVYVLCACVCVHARGCVCVCARVHLPVCLVLPCMICTSSGAVSAV